MNYCSEICKQFIFPYIMQCTHIYPDGSSEKVMYGQYEAVMITKKNGWGFDKIYTLAMPNYYIEEITKKDGTRIIFDKPFLLTNEKEYGDGSGRIAAKYL